MAKFCTPDWTTKVNKIPYMVLQVKYGNTQLKIYLTMFEVGGPEATVQVHDTVAFNHSITSHERVLLLRQELNVGAKNLVTEMSLTSTQGKSSAVK
jgi:hypothetical protein